MTEGQPITIGAVWAITAEPIRPGSLWAHIAVVKRPGVLLRVVRDFPVNQMMYFNQDTLDALRGENGYRLTDVPREDRDCPRCGMPCYYNRRYGYACVDPDCNWQSHPERNT